MIFLKPRYFYLLALLIYAFAGLWLLPYYQHQINPDGVSYISVAQNYLEGDFKNAVNGYWSPLFSWLLIPFLAAGIEPLLATKVMALFIGLLVFVGASELAYRYRISESQHNLMLITLIPLVLLFVFQTVTPDLLSVTILLFYFAYIFDLRYHLRKHAGLLCGLLGGLAFLTKNYALPFFLIHFVLFSLMHYFSTQAPTSRKTVLNHLLIGLLVFLAIAGTWIGIISAKYGELTVGTNVGYNLALTTGSRGHPIYHAGLIEPADTDANSVWEDPSEIDLAEQSQNETMEALSNYVKRTRRNLFAIFHTFRGFSLAALLSMLIAVLYIVPIRRSLMQSIIFFTLVSVLLYTSGYALIWILPRYLWIAWVLMLLLSFEILNRVFQLEFFSKPRVLIVTGLFVFSFWLAPIRHLATNLGTGENNYLLAQELSEYDISGNIVANQDWNETSYLAFYNGYKFLGLTEPDVSPELFELLRQRGIDYYFFWTHDDQDPEGVFPFLEEWYDATENEVDFIRVYSLQN